MDADGLSIINPSVIQQNHDLEDEEFAQQEADEKRAIEEAVCILETEHEKQMIF